jgi:asparagine synthetase B (glutamine-hydrolysing)
MCGIAGILRLHEPADGPPPPPDAAIPESWLDTLDDAIKHRGPDGHGRFRDRATRPDGAVVDVALTHRRLSILDHEGGHQPMVHAREPDQSDLDRRRASTGASTTTASCAGSLKPAATASRPTTPTPKC